MKKIITALVILAVIALGTYYLVWSGGANDTSGTSVYTPPPANNLNANAVVGIKNFSFSPKTLTIKTGAKVTWTNNDSAPHTITSDSGNLLDSRTISPGQSFSFTFSSAGSVNYHCSIHPMMKGAIVVTN